MIKQFYPDLKEPRLTVYLRIIVYSIILILFLIVVIELFTIIKYRIFVQTNNLEKTFVFFKLYFIFQPNKKDLLIGGTTGGSFVNDLKEINVKYNEIGIIGRPLTMFFVSLLYKPNTNIFYLKGEGGDQKPIILYSIPYTVTQTKVLFLNLIIIKQKEKIKFIFLI